MKQILIVNGLPKRTISDITMLYENTKAMVHSSDGDTDFFDIFAEVFHCNALAPYLFILCQDYVFRTSINLIKETRFTLKSHEIDDIP